MEEKHPMNEHSESAMVLFAPYRNPVEGQVLVSSLLLLLLLDLLHSYAILASYA